MAALQAIDASGADRDDMDIPIIADGNFIAAVSRELEGRSRKWACPRLLAILQLAWAVTLSALRVAGTLTTETTPQLDDDELFMDLALEGGVFHSLPDLLLPGVSGEEFYLRRLHGLITDFLALMPLRIKELRNRADEAARNKLMHEQEGIQYTVPLAGQHFGQLLLAVAALYAGDPLELGLATAYWGPTDQAVGVAAGGGSLAGDSRLGHTLGKQVALYKFVRLAGDLLMPSLFVPYITMLGGLADNPAAAALCFTLLKQNSAGGGGNGASNVSLDHFFYSLTQYYQNLRQEMGGPNAGGGSAAAAALGLDHPIYRTKPLTRGISPQELEGLAAVLDLLIVLARRSDLVRLSLAEHPHWAVVPTVLGLLACSVPCPIKARLVELLAALALSPDLVHPLWLAIEQAQLLGSAGVGGGGNSGRPGGIAGELEEVETRAEEFPLTRAFIHLLDRLTDVEIPSALGAGSRAPPGILPYLNFVQDAVFLRFSTRTYRNPAEKWEIATDCLGFFRKLLQEYEPSPADFTSGGSAGLHPGFYLLSHLHQTSLLLRTVLFVLDEARTLLDTYSPFPGKKNLEAAATAALELLEAGLRLSDEFIAAGRAAGASVVLTSLSKLMLGLNPRTGRPDHMLNVTKFVYYGYWMTAAKLAAVKVIGYVAALPANQPALLATLTATTEISYLTLKAFTDALDTDDEEEDEEKGGGEASRGPKLAGRELGATRLAILDLLQTGLGMTSPSLAHFLLGFDVRRDISRSELQSPAVAGIRTPLHAIVSLLTPTEPGTPAAIVTRMPPLATAMFQLIFTLVSNPKTAEPVLRFLRSGGDFFASQLTCITAVLEQEVHSLRSAAWLLRATAVELRVLAKTRQISQVAKLLGLLLDAAACSDHLDGGSGADSGQDVNATTASGLYSNTTFSQLSRTMAQPSSRYQSNKLDSPLANHRLIAILNSISFRLDQLPPARWELFDDSQVAAVLEQCEEVVLVGGQQQRLIAVPRLHRILAAELAALQGSTGINQRALVQAEIQAILQHAVRWNAIQEGAAASRDLLDAWRQVTEVLLVTAPADQLPVTGKQQILLQLLQTLLNKVAGGSSSEETAPGLAHLVSSAVLLLLTALRETYESVPDRATVLGDTFVGLLDATTRGGHQQQGTSSATYSASLHVILKGLVGWVLTVGAGSQVIRTNIYSALLAFLRIGKCPASSRTTATAASLELSEAGKLQKANLEIIISQGGPALLEILTRDASAGHEIRRMLALAVLDELVMLDRRGSSGACVRFLADQGFLKHLVESLLTEEAGLVSLVTHQPGANLRDMYVFEAKLGLLSRVAARPEGAEMLLQAGLMARLAEFSVLDLRPDPEAALLLQQRIEDGVDGADGGLARYHSVLFPVLRLCQVVLASLGGENRSAAAQTLHFLTGHEEVLSLMLRASSTRASLAPALLQELALVTGVVSRAATLDIRAEALDAAGFELSGQLARIQRQMLGLLQVFQLTDSLVAALQEEEEQEGGVVQARTPSRSLLIMQVIGNVVSYARAVVSAGGQSSRSCRLVVSPSLLEDSGQAAAGRPATLGLLVTTTRSMTAQLARSQGRLEALEEKASSLASLPTTELLALAGLPPTEKLPSLTVRRLAAAKVECLASSRREELLLAATALESLAFLIWRHLEHFLLYSSAAIAAPPATPYQATVRRLNEGRSELGDAAATASPRTAFAKVDLDKLKSEVRAVMNETFFERMADTVDIVERATNSRTSTAGFLQAIIRRSKRLALLHTQ